MESLDYLTYIRLIKAARSLLKGGDQMSEAIDIAIRTAKRVEEGKCPLDPAGVIQDLLHTAATERYAEDREARRIGEEKMLRDLEKSAELTKKMR